MLPKSLQHLIYTMRVFPGVGQKTAQRYALHLIERKRAQAQELYRSINHALEQLEHCNECGVLKEIDHTCLLCSHPDRDQSTLLIVPSLFDVIHFEALACYKGLYHILGGQLSPLDGIGPNELHLHNLTDRVNSNNINEVILALSPTLEGEATAYYIGHLLKECNTIITRLATGIPVGGDVENIDAHTLMLSLKQRYHYQHS